jgi:hypothetical protein
LTDEELKEANKQWCVVFKDNSLPFGYRYDFHGFDTKESCAEYAKNAGSQDGWILISILHNQKPVEFEIKTIIDIKD